jgi:WD40 repeat protein
MRTSIPLAVARLLAAAVIVLALPAAGVARAASPGRNGTIAYSETWNQQFAHDTSNMTFVVTPQGSPTAELWGATDPQWSPGGGRLAGTDNRMMAGPNCKSVFVERRGVSTLLTDDCSSADPSWSPDGSRLVFVRGAAWTPTWQGPAGLWIIGANGDHARLLSARTPPPDPAFSDRFAPAWAPHGHRIAFTKNGWIWTIRPDGSNLRRVVEGGSPDWLPGPGLRLLYTAPSGSTTVLQIMDLPSRIATTVPNSAGAGAAAVSPNGGQVVYVRDNAIWRMRLDGTGLRYVGGPAHGGTVGSPAWQPLR